MYSILMEVVNFQNIKSTINKLNKEKRINKIRAKKQKNLNDLSYKKYLTRSGWKSFIKDKLKGLSMNVLLLRHGGKKIGLLRFIGFRRSVFTKEITVQVGF